MSRNFKKTVCLLLATVLLISAVPMTASASWLSDWFGGSQQEESDHPLTYRAVDYTAEMPESKLSAVDACGGTTIPSSYSSVTEGKVTGVKDQGNYGTCWAFSATSSCEGALIENASIKEDLSELQLAYYFYNDKKDALGNANGDKTSCLTENCLEQGGNHLFTMWGLVGWTNGETEESLPYSAANCEAAIAGTLDDSYANDNDIGHVQNAYIIPYGTSSSYLDNIKSAVMEYGSVSCAYYHSSTYYNSTYGSYYTTKSGINHAVSIVGWNDDYSRSNFKRRPSKSGAWLVKNSWGTDWGTDGDADATNSGAEGYFWISYYDYSLRSSGQVYVFDFDNSEDYQYNYQYDGSCGIKTLSVAAGGTLCATYTVNGTNGSASEAVTAVGFGVASTDMSGTVSVYSASADSNPMNGTLLASQTFTTDYAGYYTVDLDNPPVVAKGQDYTVAVTFDSACSAYIDTTYQNGTWISFTADTANDRTYYVNGSAVTDLADLSETARVKAYTKDAGEPLDTYAVTYDANGGSGAPANQIKIEGKDLTLSTTVPIRAGYTFLGWATTTDTAAEVEYASGATYTADAALALYAVWQQKVATVLSLDNSTIDLLIDGDEKTVTVIPDPADTILTLSVSGNDGITVTKGENNQFTLKAQATASVGTKSIVFTDSTSGKSVILKVNLLSKTATGISVTPNTLSLTVGGAAKTVTLAAEPDYAECTYEVQSISPANGVTVTGSGNTFSVQAESYVADTVTVTFVDKVSQKTAVCTVTVQNVVKDMAVSVVVNKKSTRYWFFSRTSYVATITATPTDTGVAKVEYSTNNSSWTTGTQYTSSSNITKLYVRVTDTDGDVYNFVYNNGTVTKN